MTRQMTCIECPVGCSMSVQIDDCRVVSVEGNKCVKGQEYAVRETADPVRILTSSVAACGLALPMVPVRTEKPIPKARMMEAMALIRNTQVRAAVNAGDIIIPDLLGLGTDLIATRDCPREGG
jgi:CxxC motif-containing protein